MTMRAVPFDQLPDVLTMEEFAEYARISRTQAYEEVAQHKIRVKRVGRRILVPKAAVADWLAGDDTAPRLRVVGGSR